VKELAAAILLCLGSAFMLLGAVGVFRFPDIYSRVPASAKAAPLGVTLMILALAIHFADFGITVSALLVIGFFCLTAPVAGHMIARAAYFTGVPLWGERITDELANRYDPFGDAAPPGAQPLPGGKSERNRRMTSVERSDRRMRMDWYRMEADLVFLETKTRESGLAEPEARERLGEHGPNRLAGEEEIDRFRIFLNQFTSPLIYILLIAALVTLLLREFTDAGVILFVVLLNAVIGFFQEYRAEESVRALRKLEVPKARVVREGREREIPSEELVPGDIVLLTSGARVPADLRLIRSLELSVEEAMLTGESLPAAKIHTPIPEENLTPGDQRNMAFMGTIVLNGRGRGIVVATGSSTVLGGIAREVREVGAAKGPSSRRWSASRT
jgi:monovalent cation/proton antiporter MnhG/PhaG subunit